MPEFLQFAFMQRALIVGLIIALAAPTIGLFFVVRRYASIADTLSHVSLAGVALSLVTGTAAIPTAFAVSVASVLAMEKLRERKTLPAETIVSLFLFGGLALGVILLGFSQGKNVSVVNYLFGNIVTVSTQDVLSIAVIGGVSVVTTLLLWPKLFAVALDEDTAEAAGLPVKWLNRILASLGAATIAISMNVVGVLLIGALMVIPVLAAMQFRVGFRATWILALIISLISVVSGLILSFYLELPSGGTIVMMTIGCFIIGLLPARKVMQKS